MKMHSATCVGTQTSKVPTRMIPLFINYSVLPGSHLRHKYKYKLKQKPKQRDAGKCGNKHQHKHKHMHKSVSTFQKKAVAQNRALAKLH